MRRLLPALSLVLLLGAGLGMLWTGSFTVAGALLAGALAAAAHLVYELRRAARRTSAGIAGVRRRACVMFCHIDAFTPRAERMQPQEVIGLLNEYLVAVTGAVARRGGTTNSFLAEGAMALFGASQALASPERSALEAAQDILVALRDINRRLEAKGAAPLKAGIGLHCGEVVLGQVGGRRRQDFAAVGEVVDTAARIEALARELGEPVLVSAVVADAVGRAGGLRSLGTRGEPPLELFGWVPPLLKAA
jgi:adenylate cyclase